MGETKLINRIRSHAQKSLERFCMTTDMHGFLEMYAAKTLVWRLIWFVVVVVAVGMTSFHINTVIKTYMDSPTVTVFTRAQHDDILYPPLRLCYNYWFRWVDWKKAMSYNHTIETLLYGFSFINTIFTERHFDASEASENFSRLLHEHDFHTISKFYKSLVKPISRNIVNNDEFAALFKEINVLYLRKMYYFCLYASSDQIRDYFHHREKSGNFNKIIEFATVDETYENFRDILTEHEYNAYMKYWINTRTVYKYNESSKNMLIDFAPTVFLFPNAYSDQSVDIVTDNYYYFVDLASSSSIWKNTDENVCMEGQTSLAYNNTCERRCEAVATLTSPNCRMLHNASIINEDFPEYTCVRAINSIKANRSIQNMTIGSTNTIKKPSTATEDVKNFSYEECMKKCINACQIWTYTASISPKQMFKTVRENAYKEMTSVTIAYPETSSIIIMTETDAQTWDSLLGNIGGLLGIWTGASLLSILQMVYLCCCADVEGWTKYFDRFERWNARLNVKRAPKIQMNPIPIIPPAPFQNGVIEMDAQGQNGTSA